MLFYDTASTLILNYILIYKLGDWHLYIWVERLERCGEERGGGYCPVCFFYSREGSYRRENIVKVKENGIAVSKR